MRFDSHGISNGCWSGELIAATPPARVALVHRGNAVAQASLRQIGPDRWILSADLPGTVVDQGAQAVALVAGDPGDAGSQVLGHLTLVAGTVIADDVLAEVAQLRAELDLLKREFRRLGASIAPAGAPAVT